MLGDGNLTCTHLSFQSTSSHLESCSLFPILQKQAGGLASLVMFLEPIKKTQNDMHGMMKKVKADLTKSRMKKNSNRRQSSLHRIIKNSSNSVVFHLWSFCWCLVITLDSATIHCHQSTDQQLQKQTKKVPHTWTNIYSCKVPLLKLN